MRLIPNWQDRKLKCHFCGDTRSVKYEMKIHDFESPIPKTVCVCSRCALTRNKREAM